MHCKRPIAYIKIHGGHRMSDTSSLLTRLKNKISYKVNNAIDSAVTDPEAEKNAKEQLNKIV